MPGSQLALIQATDGRLNSRRKARKPVMPMPRRAIELGSGVVPTGAELTFSEVVAVWMWSLAPENVGASDVEPMGPAVLVSNVNTTEPDEVASNVTVTVLPDSAIETPVSPDDDTIVRLLMGSTLGVYATSRSVTVVPAGAVIEKLVSVVTSVDPAWLDAVKDKLTRRPAAKARKKDRFIIQNLH